ncbi:MAG: hypothetical protein ACRDV9_01700 [Acidimicrobiia bacterium]
MRSLRTKLLISGVAAGALVLGSVGGASAVFGPGEAFGFVWTEYGAVEAQETVDLVAKQGKSLVTQRYVIPPNFSGLWPTHQGPNYVMHVKGSSVNTYEGCGSEAVTWDQGKGYYRDGSASPQGMRLENPNSDDAELIVVWLDVNPADAHNTLPYGTEELKQGACTPAVDIPHYEYARGPAHTDIPWSHEQGTFVIAMHFLTSPQWHFQWHTHPPTFITHLRGPEREYIGCPEIIDWQPNVTYLHSPGAFGRPQERAKNVSNDEATEFWVMFSKGPAQRVRGSIPVTFTGPPEECVTDGTLTNTNSG